MNIEDVSKVYNFLGSIDLLAFISFCILLSITLWILILSFRERSKAFIKFTSGVIIVVNLAFTALYIDAANNSKYLQLANFVKGEMVGKSYKTQSFQYIIFPDRYNSTKSAMLTAIATRFPEEFFMTEVKDQLGAVQKGLLLLDEKANRKIEQQINSKANLTSHLLAAMINSGIADTIYVNKNLSRPGLKSLQQIDLEGWLIGREFFNALIGRNDLEPVWDERYNIIAFIIPKKRKG
jgi:hypothetical protein